MENTMENTMPLEDAVFTWNRCKGKDLVKRYLPNFEKSCTYIYDATALKEHEPRAKNVIVYNDHEYTPYEFFLKFKFNDEKDPCDAFIIEQISKILTENEARKAKVSEELLSEEKKAEAEEIESNKGGLPDWLIAQGRFSPKGLLLEDFYNYKLILDHENYNLRRNDLTHQVEFDVPAWMHRTNKNKIFTDDDAKRIFSHVNDLYGLKTMNTLDLAIETVASEHAYHPIKDFFASLPAWDGIPRIEGLLKEVLNVNDEFYQDENGIVHNFADEVLKLVMTAAYTRVMSDEPVKYDQGVLLIGPQGRCKSTFIKKLAFGFSTDSVTFSDITEQSGKRAIEKIEGTMFAEVPEFYFSNSRRERDAVKSFMTQERDEFRRAYGKRVEKINRLTVFIMTSNDESHNLLADPTGSRRWLILDCGKDEPHYNVFDLMTPDFVKQLWAELLDKEKHDKSIAEETSIMIKPGSGLYTFANNKAIDNLKTDSRDDDVLRLLRIPLPANWNTWTDFERKDYLRDPSLNKINAQETKPRKYVSKKCIWCDIMGKPWEDRNKSDEFCIENICTKLGLIPCSWADRKVKFPGGVQPRTYWRIPTEEEWLRSHPNGEYPFVFDPEDIAARTQSESYYTATDKADQAERLQNISNQKLQEVGVKAQAAISALEQGNIKDAMKLITEIKSTAGPIATSEEDLTDIL